jgi:tetratricopeptide (TPR) repeat protein
MNARTSLNGCSLNIQKNRAVISGHAAALSRQSSNPTRFNSQRSSRQTTWLDPSAQDRLLRRRSLSEAQQGNYLEAIAGLTILIDRNPENALDYNNRGLVHFQCGDQDAAIEDYNKAIQLNPRLAGAYNNRANYYVAQGELEAAIADYDMAVDLDPTNIRAWLNQGITFRDLGLYGDAIESFEHALQIKELMSINLDDNPILEAHIYAARGRAHHLVGDWNFAVADYRRALNLIPDSDISGHRLRSQVNHWLKALTDS